MTVAALFGQQLDYNFLFLPGFQLTQQPETIPAYPTTDARHVALIAIAESSQVESLQTLMNTARHAIPAIATASYAFDLNGQVFSPTGSDFSEEDKALARRLSFFSDPAELPFLLAPICLRSIVNRAKEDAFVFAYSSTSGEQLVDACKLLVSGCEAVLIRPDEGLTLVAGLARTKRNEKLLAHWADLTDQIASYPNNHSASQVNVGADVVSFVCHKIAVLRVPGSILAGSADSPMAEFARLPAGAKLTPFLRTAVRRFLPQSKALQDDPLGNLVEVLNQPSEQVPQEPGRLITKIMFLVWSERIDLQVAFDLSREAGRERFVDWFLTRGPVEIDLGEEFILPVKVERDSWQGVSPVPSVGSENADATDGPHGLNLVGYPRAEMGMGEHVRLTAAALMTTDIPFGIIDFNVGVIASQNDKRYDHLIRRDHPFDINLFHINADQMHLGYEKLGADFFRKCYNIGYWAWELNEFPDAWLPAIDLVDEIWAPSMFIQRAIARKTRKPVAWMPLAVEFPIPEDPRREAFGLPATPYLFFFFFDFSSFATRKNAIACVDAFRRAFPTDTGVGLVIKTIRHEHHKEEFWKLLRKTGDDSRISLIDRLLRQTELHSLTACCDCFISLHRSEGFGRGLAEAMYLGKPVIATNYSGNVDFTKPDNSCLVGFRLISVKEHEYVYPEGQSWADPDVDQASAYMRRLVNEPQYGKRLGHAAAKFIRQQHSCKAIGARYAARIEQIRRARDILTGTPEQPGPHWPELPGGRIFKKLFSIQRDQSENERMQ